MKNKWEQLGGNPVSLKAPIVRSKEERLADFRSTSAESAEKAKRSLSFMGTGFLLSPGMHALCAPTGSGKTSSLANLVNDALNRTSPKLGTILVLLNEEKVDDFLLRIAGIRLEIPMQDIKSGRITAQQNQLLHAEVETILERVEVVYERDWNLNCLEDVIAVFHEIAARTDICLVVFDYLQNLTESRVDLLPWEISKRFGTEMKNLGKSSLQFPIVVGCQIKPGSDPYQSRLQNDKTFCNHCTTVIEIEADMENRISDFVIRKDRWNGKNGAVYSFNWNQQKLVYASNEVRVMKLVSGGSYE